MTSKYDMAARARKKKRTVSSLGQAMKKAGKLSPKRSAQLATRQSEMRRQALRKKSSPSAQAFMKGIAPKKKALTPAEKRRRQQMSAKATTARAKASAKQMDKKIAKIKKEK